MVSDSPSKLPVTTRSRVIIYMFLFVGLLSPVITSPALGAADSASATIERDATTAFKNSDYDRVLKLWRSVPAESQPSKLFLRLVVQSFLKLGHPEDAFTLYQRLVPTDQPDDPVLLRAVALGMITSHVRDTKEHVRIAAYTTLAELGLKETRPVLEDGLLDSSVLVRARAVEAIGRAGLASTSGPVRRALQDEMPAVRIAAMNALADANATDIIPRLLEVARNEDSPEGIFAYAALYKLGKHDMLTDITSAATLPDPEVRMAAFGVLGRLKRPSTVSVLSQGVYDPEPSVRAFAAGALGEYGTADGVAPLTHALGDEVARVRGVAAVSLGRLGIRDTRPLIQALLRDASMQVRASAVEGLLRLGDASVTLIVTDLARHSDPSIRAAAAQALGATSDKQGMAILHTLLQDQQPQPRLSAAKALGKIVGPVVPWLKRGLQDSDEAVRLTAAGSLIQQLSHRSTPTKGRSKKGAPCSRPSPSSHWLLPRSGSASISASDRWAPFRTRSLTYNNRSKACRATYSIPRRELSGIFGGVRA